MELSGKALYLAVRCQNNSSHVIALKVIEFEADGTAAYQEWADMKPFAVTCERCQEAQVSFGYDVIVWLGPQPDAQFKTHKAFSTGNKRS